MEEKIKEIKLLQDYIKTLQKQNDARNAEKTTLYKQMDRLIAENELLSKNQHKGDTVVSRKQDLATITRINSQISTLISLNVSLNQQIAELNTKMVQLREQLQTKQNNIVRLSQEKQRYIQELSSFKSLEAQNSQNAQNIKRILLLESEIRVFKNRMLQIDSLEQKHRECLVKISTLENQNRNLKINQPSANELTNMTSQYHSLQITNRQLNSKTEQLESSIKLVQKQNSLLQTNLRQVELELQQKRNSLFSLKKSQEMLRSVEGSMVIKDKQMQALEQMISNLKDNKKYLQKSLKEKEQVISSMEEQIYHLKSQKLQDQRSGDQLSQIKIQNSELIRQKSNNHQKITQLTSQISSLHLKISHGQRQLVELIEGRDKLLRQNESHSKIVNELRKESQLLKERNSQLTSRLSATNQNLSKGKKNHKLQLTEDEDLRQIVKRLRVELDEVKHSNIRLQNQNLKALSYLESQYQQPKGYYPSVSQLTSHRNCSNSNCHFQSDISLNDKYSPRVTTHTHSRVINSHQPRELNSNRAQKPYYQIQHVRSVEKQANNRSKWENLQRKINHLRIENDELKKSLFQ